MHDHHFKLLTCEISELDDDNDLDEGASDTDGQGGFAATMKAYLHFLAAVKSVETFDLTVNITSDPPVGTMLLSALGRFSQVAASKVNKVKLELLCNGPEDDDASRYRTKGNSARIKQMLQAMPASLVSNLHLSGITGASKRTASALGDALGTLVNLTDLGITECLVDMTSWKPSGLKVLSLSCIGEGGMQKSFPAAYGIINSSSQTLERITLHDTQGCRLKVKLPAKPLQLPQLRHLELADRDISRGSLFATLLPSIKVPKLQYLYLDMVDVFTPDLSAVVTRIPTLKGLHLGQGLLRCEADDAAVPSNPGFHATKLACAKAGVDLRVTYTTDLCHTGQDLEDEIVRVGIVADNLITLSLGVAVNAATGFEDMQPLCLPKLSHLFIALVPSDINDEAATASGNPDILGRALSKIDAPLLRSLKLSVSVGNKIDTLRSVITTLKEGRFSKLTVVGEDILQDQLEAIPSHENSIQSAIFDCTADTTSVRFITVMDEDTFTDEETIVDSEEGALETSLSKLDIED